ncbi:DUF86 domain-containing protein [Parabacteroides sp. AF17-28]|jgi:uncharacterized protein with HEPN domain|uniref:HepT-like ribonuclease domain-containing protein n=1 Tax=Parabacteroides sp. AF17-28 TaxID=2292241 RepID=UPI000EFEF08A|nr:DUF86 domain-containing protein [Parabacteroides sp. AF17-28]RHR51282.1 DUF86 domain-containing protein [Parabacteroides sp. AF17-28]
MQYISKETVLDMLSFSLMRTDLAVECAKEIGSHRDFLLSNEGMNLFDATCMRLQTIGETMKKVDGFTDGRLLASYQEIPWKKIFGLRNMISHEYASVDSEVIFNIVKKYLPPLSEALQRIIADLEAGRQDDLFRQLKDKLY